MKKATWNEYLSIKEKRGIFRTQGWEKLESARLRRNRKTKKKEEGESKECTQTPQEEEEQQIYTSHCGPDGICKFQTLTNFLIRKLPFARWARRITPQERGTLRFQVMTLLIVQDQAEVYIGNLFKDANLCKVYVKRVTLMPKRHPTGMEDAEGYGEVPSN